jgi:hypothetical protein
LPGPVDVNSPVGAAVGVIFAPSILDSGLARAGAGALIGHLHESLSRPDLEEIGEMLDESDVASIVAKKEVRAEEKEIEKAIDEA